MYLDNLSQNSGEATCFAQQPTTSECDQTSSYTELSPVPIETTYLHFNSSLEEEFGFGFDYHQSFLNNLLRSNWQPVHQSHEVTTATEQQAWSQFDWGAIETTTTTTKNDALLPVQPLTTTYIPPIPEPPSLVQQVVQAQEGIHHASVKQEDFTGEVVSMPTSQSSWENYQRMYEHNENLINSLSPPLSPLSNCSGDPSSPSVSALYDETSSTSQTFSSSGQSRIRTVTNGARRKMMGLDGMKKRKISQAKISTEDDRSNKRKRRTHFLPDQLESLEELFEEVKYPDAAQCEDFADRLGLSASTVQIWFKNRRAKSKNNPSRSPRF